MLKALAKRFANDLSGKFIFLAAHTGIISIYMYIYMYECIACGNSLCVFTSYV